MNENDYVRVEKVRGDHYGSEFEKAANFTNSYLGIADALKTESLRPVAEAFERNLNRMRTMAMLPGRLALGASIGGGAVSLMVQAAVAGKNIIQRIMQSPTPETGAQIGEEISLVFRQKIAEWDSQIGAITIDGKTKEESITQIKDVFERMHPGVASAIAKLNIDVIREALHALLFAQVTGSWTAFETLASDLWIATVNERPRNLVSKMRPKNKDEESKWVSLNVLCRYDFDLTGRMGSVLAESKKVSFKMLEDIRKAYRAIFSENSSINVAIAGVDLECLHAVRNVIVHRGGFADAMFCERVTRIPYWGGFNVGDELVLDGETVANLTNAAVNGGLGLLREVDEWLVRDLAQSRSGGATET
jgi:hypothetical protein